MAEALSNTVSLSVFSIKFDHCQKIYPLRLIRPVKKKTVDFQKQLYLVLYDLRVNNCIISQFIGDNPIRSMARLCLSHSSWFPCEYCFAKGTKLIIDSIATKKTKDKVILQQQLVKEKIDRIKNSPNPSATELAKFKKMDKELNETVRKIGPKKSNIVWPKESMNAPLRTRDAVQKIVEKIENKLEISNDEAKGIVGRSLFFDIPNFDFFLDITVEYLHGVCIGVVKKTVELTFKVTDQARPRVTNRKLSPVSLFNSQIKKIKFVREFNRRIRELDFAVYKWQEFRNLLLFLFPLILNCIEPQAKERHLWLYLTYSIKACVIPSEEFKAVPLDVIGKCTEKFYSIYEALFGALNCTYNTHVVIAHLLEIRHNGPLTETSAFPFESFYGELRNSFVPGTTSTIKQIMGNVLMKRAIAHHSCLKDIFISVHETPLECNNLVYCFKNKTYSMYKIINILEQTLICHKFDTVECTFPETPQLNWGLIGVFKKGRLSGQQEQINKNDVKGKIIVVNDYLITCPLNVLREQ